MKQLIDYINEAAQFQSLKSGTYDFEIKHSNWMGKIQIESKQSKVIISRING